MPNLFLSLITVPSVSLSLRRVATPSKTWVHIGDVSDTKSPVWCRGFTIANFQDGDDRSRCPYFVGTCFTPKKPHSL